MFSILYVDEQVRMQEDFELKVFLSKSLSDSSVTSLLPLKNLDEMVDSVLEMHSDVLVTDFKLDEHQSDVKYNGVDLARAIQLRKSNFPCFIITAYEDKAFSSHPDVNIVYDRKVVSDEFVQKRTDEEELIRDDFFKRVRIQIESYRYHLGELQKEFNDLVRLSNSGSLNLRQEERLLELDDLIENYADKDSKLPSKSKTSEVQAQFSELMTETQSLIQKLKALDK